MSPATDPVVNDAYATAVTRLLTRMQPYLPPTDHPDDEDAQHAAWCKRSLRAFVEHAWQYVEPTKTFVSNWHIDTLCDVLERVSRGEITQLLINVPPGTMKSLLVSVFWPAWEWTHHPELRYLTASYSGHLTVRDNLKVRDIIQSAWYQKYYGMRLVDDQNQKTLFKNDRGGWRIATSVGGPGTGEHPDRIIIDDPLTADEARSAQERSNCTTWYDGTVSTRGKTRNVAVIVVAQRLHEDDLPGHLLRRGGWTHICWPMKYVPTRPAKDNDAGHTADPLDPRREANALLWPSLFTPEIVRQLELDLGPYGTAGQLQQSPAPEGGGLFKREWFKFLDAIPGNIVRRVRGWDTAATEGAGDWTVGVKMGELSRVDDKGRTQPSGQFLVEGIARIQGSPYQVDQLMSATAHLDGRGCAQREEKEGGASGKAVVEARARALKGYDYRGVLVSGDKVTRAKPYRSQCEAGNVFLLRTGDASRDAWIEPYIQELCGFPTGAHDDQVDGSSCAFNAILLEPVGYVNVREAVWG